MGAGAAGRGQSFVSAGSPWPSDPASSTAPWQTAGDMEIELARISCLKFVFFGWSLQAPSALVSLNTVVYWG